MRYAILGGTFNPIHIGHMIMAEYVFSTGIYDKILIMPSGDPPHKHKSEIIDKEHRMNMCQLSTRKKPYLEVSSMELDRKGTTYTVDTLKSLSKDSDNQYDLIIGTDSLMNLEKWYEADNLFQLTHFVVIQRVGDKTQDIHEKIEYYKDHYKASISVLSMPLIEISSTEIRQRTSQHQSISYLVEKSVESYIIEQKLYQVVDTLENVYKKTMEKSLKNTLSKKRFNHTISVKRVARALASHHNVEVNSASIAALLHDCAKHYTNEELVALSKKYHVDLSEEYLKNPQIIHSKLGALIANDLYEVVDQDILNAITYHTTARPGMSSLEMIIFIADYIEPTRKSMKSIERYRVLAYQSLEMTMYYILKDTIEYLEQKKINYAKETKDAYVYYQQLIKEKQ